MDRYLVPAGHGEKEYIEKRSRFIGRVWHIDSEAEAIERIKEIREKHWDATHNVYAYSIKNGGIMRSSDDGEPSGTSGMPVLNVFRSGGVQDFCCVVTRYFGGVLLGAGGLVRAYTKSASIALEAAGIAEMKELFELQISCSYPLFERIKSELKNFSAELINTEYSAEVMMKIILPDEEDERFSSRVTELSAGTVCIRHIGKSLRPVRI